MEPSDSKSIAETLIHKHGKDIGWADTLNGVLDAMQGHGLGFNDAVDLADEVYDLIPTAKITVTFE